MHARASQIDISGILPPVLSDNSCWSVHLVPRSAVLDSESIAAPLSQAGREVLEADDAKPLLELLRDEVLVALMRSL